jgi:ribosomal protein S18 acetylase RimI-like enzyme
MAEIAIRRLGVEGLGSVEPLYRALHAHHRAIAEVPLVEDADLSWRRRRAWYHEALNGGGVLLLAEADGAAVGYAVLELRRGPDDTWPVGERYAELLSLAVAPDRRGRGIGERLMRAVDAELERAGASDLMVGVLAGNDAALRFYARHGLAVGELVLWRFGAPAADAGGAP